MVAEKRKRRWLIRMTIISAVLMLFAPLGLYHLKNRADFNRRVNQLAAAGCPVSMADLEKAYVLPEGAENAAEIYEKAFLLYVEPNEMESGLLPVRGDYMSQEGEPPYLDDVMDMVRQSLDKNAECLELVGQAARMDHCLYNRSYKLFGMNIDHLRPMKFFASMLVERNLLLAQTQQTDALFDSIQTCIGLSKSMSPTLFLIEHLVKVAIEAMTAANLENSLNLTCFSEEQLFTLQQQFHEMSQADSLIPSLIGERAKLIEVLRLSPLEMSKYYSFSGAPSWSQKAVDILSFTTGLQGKDAVLLLDFHERKIEIARLPLYQQPAEIDKLQKELDSYPWYHYGLHRASPSYRIYKINLRIKGQLQCAETALAIERYRLKYGSLPDSLQTLVPEFIETVYLDPFDGKPLRYVLPETGGYMLYTIGEDGVDNGGLDRNQMEKKTGSRSKEYDHPFTVKR